MFMSDAIRYVKKSLPSSPSDIEYAKNYAKMAESAKTLASQQVTRELFFKKH